MNYKTLIYDIESTPDVSYTYGQRWKPILLKVKEPAYILSVAYKWRGDKGTKILSLDQYDNFCDDPKDDSALLTEFAKVLDEADFLVAHNQKFDLPKIRTRMVYHDLEPLKHFAAAQDVCTLKMAQRLFGFNSNRLKDLAEYLGVSEKGKIDQEVWLSIVEDNDPKSWAHMKRYNKKDVVVTEQVFERLGKWSNKVTQSGGCTHCGSNDYVEAGWTHPSAARTQYKRFRCTGVCGKKFHDKSIKRKADVSTFR